MITNWTILREQVGSWPKHTHVRIIKAAEIPKALICQYRSDIKTIPRVKLTKPYTLYDNIWLPDWCVPRLGRSDVHS